MQPEALTYCFLSTVRSRRIQYSIFSRRTEPKNFQLETSLTMDPQPPFLASRKAIQQVSALASTHNARTKQRQLLQCARLCIMSTQQYKGTEITQFESLVFSSHNDTALPLSRPIFLPLLLYQPASLKPQCSHEKITTPTSERKSSILVAVRGSRSFLVSRKQQGMMELNELSHSVLFSAPGQGLMENQTSFYLSVF